MPSLKDVKLKIAGVGKTKQITKAMNMVASAKLRGAQARIERFRPYAEKYQDVLTELASKVEGSSHPLLMEHPEKKNCAIIDRTAKLAASKIKEGFKVRVACVGRKGRDAFRRNPNVEMMSSYVDCMGSLDFSLASTVAQELIHQYTEGDVDEVFLIYGEFISMASQPPRLIQLLPFVKPEADEGAAEEPKQGPNCEYLYEPSEESLLGVILPQYIKVQIFRGMLDTSASENAARMTAMDNATRNCNDLIRSLTLLYNKTRQASITSELIDIVGGAEALNG